MLDLNAIMTTSSGYTGICLVSVKTAIEQLLPPSWLNHHLYRRLNPLLLPLLGAGAGMAGLVVPSSEIASRGLGGALIGILSQSLHHTGSSLISPPVAPHPDAASTVPPPPKVKVDSPD